MKIALANRLLVVALACIAVTGGCTKKNVVASVPPAAQAEPAAPTVELTANPFTLQAGESAELTWTTTNAAQIELEGVGSVEVNGTHKVTPANSTTYKLIAKGPGGEKEAVVQVTVTPAAPDLAAPQPEAPPPNAVRAIFFDYDKSGIRPNQMHVLISNADFLRDHAEIRVLLEGHADERGSTEYNLALGDPRANAVMQGLVRAGVSAERIETVSYGKERPFCKESNEVCWQDNRRAHFVLAPN